jgi:competence protein ComEA
MAEKPAKNVDRRPGLKTPGTASHPLLKRADQAAVATLVAFALVGMSVYWFAQGGHRGELIEIDRAAPLTARFLVDINSAEWPELAELPDIGETLARRIVESRAAAGRFADHDDLLRVRGIGPLTLEKLRPYLLPLPDQENVAGDVNIESTSL